MQTETFLGGNLSQTKTFEGSSSIKEAQYDTVLEVLTIGFTNGTKYKYSAVPSDKVEAFFEAPSAGRYFSTEIKPFYNYTKGV